MKTDIGIETEKMEIKIAILQDKIQSLETIIGEMSSRMKIIDGSTDVWKGKVQEAVYTRYLNEKNKLLSIVKELQRYKTFLEKTVTNYKNAETVINNSINREDLSIND